MKHNIATYFDQCYQSVQTCAVILHPVPSFIDALPFPCLNLSLSFSLFLTFPSWYFLQLFHLFLADHALVPLHAAAIPILGCFHLAILCVSCDNQLSFLGSIQDGFIPNPAFLLGLFRLFNAVVMLVEANHVSKTDFTTQWQLWSHHVIIIIHFICIALYILAVSKCHRAKQENLSNA